MELTTEKQAILMLALNAYEAELKERIACFEEAIAEGEERYNKPLMHAKANLKRTVELYREVRSI